MDALFAPEPFQNAPVRRADGDAYDDYGRHKYPPLKPVSDSLGNEFLKDNRYDKSKTPTNNLSKFAGNVAFPKREGMGLCPTNKDLQWYNNSPTEGPMPYTKSWYNVLLMFEQQMFNVSLTPLPISSLVNAANTTLEDMVKFIKYGPMSITCRPDITHAVGRLSRFMHKPEAIHAAQARTLLGYMLQTVNSKLVYSRDNRIVKDTLREYGKKDSEILDLIYNQDAFGQCDADYASVKEPSLKSTTGYCFFAWHNLICWKSKLQPILATSTHESELIAMNLAAQEAMSIRNLMAEMRSAITGQPLDDLIDNSEHAANIYWPKVDHDDEAPADTYNPAPPTFILGDNLGAIETAKQPISSKQSKHIQIRYFKIREYQEQNFLKIKHIDGNENTADMFTKVIPEGAFYKYIKNIGMKMSKEDWKPSK